jgi:hypothetical protein
VPTLGGTLLAALVTLTGTIGQIVAVTWQGAGLTSGHVKSGVIVLGAAIGYVVVRYALKALYGFALTGTKPAENTRSEEERAARHVADAIRDKPELPPPDEYPSRKPPDDYPAPSEDLPTSTGDDPRYAYARNTLL